jgi:hypothetical protein
VARLDDDPEPDQVGLKETSKLYWNGLYITYRKGPVSFMIHGVVNTGHFNRSETFSHLNPVARESVINYLKDEGYQFVDEDIPVDQKNVYSLFFQDSGSDPVMSVMLDPWRGTVAQRKHEVAATAGQWEILYQINDRIQAALMQAAGSGRLGLEEDGSSSDYRRDQFRTANSSFQMTDIAVDTSGGYSIFAGGRLTGIQIRGGDIRYRIFDSLNFKIGYFAIDANHAPTMNYNAYYTKYPFYVNYSADNNRQITAVTDNNVQFTYHPGIRKNERYIGQEVNLVSEWKLMAGLNLEARAAWFEAGDGYRAWKDVQYGKDITEVSFSLSQLF